MAAQQPLDRNELLARYFWPPGEPYPRLPEYRRPSTHFLRAEREAFWEAYEEARSQGLAHLDVQYRVLRETYLRLKEEVKAARVRDRVRQHIEAALQLLLPEIHAGRISLPFYANEVRIHQEEQGELLASTQTEASSSEPGILIDRGHRFSPDDNPPIHFDFNALPVVVAEHGRRTLHFLPEWPAEVPRPLSIVLPNIPLRAAELRERLCEVLPPLDPSDQHLLEEVSWQLGVVATARWHLALGIDPPRDQPELLLSEKDRDIRARLLSENRRKRHQALFELFQQAYKAENPDGLKKLPNLAWDRILERVFRRLEELYVTPEQIGYRPEDFYTKDTTVINRWQQWFLKRRRRSRK